MHSVRVRGFGRSRRLELDESRRPRARIEEKRRTKPERDKSPVRGGGGGGLAEYWSREAPRIPIQVHACLGNLSVPKLGGTDILEGRNPLLSRYYMARASPNRVHSILPINQSTELDLHSCNPGNQPGTEAPPWDIMPTINRRDVLWLAGMAGWSCRLFCPQWRLAAR